MEAQIKRESRISSSLSSTKPSKEISPPSKHQSKRQVVKKTTKIIAPLSEENELDTVPKMNAALKDQKKIKELFPVLEDLVEAALILLKDGIRNIEEKTACKKLLYALNVSIEENHEQLAKKAASEGASLGAYTFIWQRLSIGNTLLELRGSLKDGLNRAYGLQDAKKRKISKKFPIRNRGTSRN